MPQRTGSILVLIATLFFLVVTAAAEELPARPRIGLCLAGGGARGGAHIGVLKVLEEMRVPVDCVAGTSIGAIVGGLYATGMSPAAMDSAVLSVDWFDVFEDEPSRTYSDIRRKREDYLPYYPIQLGIGSDGIKMPGGLVAGQKLMFLLRRLTLHATGIEDFDRLSIPFRAVSVDLEEASVVVHDRGTLADALRASMSIPGAFTPHEIDGRVLVDGGVLHNIPYDVVKAMGADIVIVVDISKPPRELPDDASLRDVIKQTISVYGTVGARASLEQVTAADLVMKPDWGGIETTAFDRMAESTGYGEAEARNHLDWLRQYSLPEDEYAAWQTRVRMGAEVTENRIGEIRLDSTGRVDPRRVMRRIRTQPGTPLDLDLLAADLESVYRLGEFELVDFSLEPGADPVSRDVTIKTRDKRWGPHYLRFGTSVEGHLSGRSHFVMLLYHRWAEINALGAEWRNQLVLGDRLGLHTEFYQPLAMSATFFAAPRLHGMLDERDRWFDGNLAEVVQSKEWETGFDLGLSHEGWGELRLGIYHGDYSGDLQNQPGALDDRRGGWRGRLILDRLDAVDFPREGWLVGGEARLARGDLGADTRYDRVALRLQGVVSTGPVSFSGHLEGGTSLGSDLPFHDRFELGGFSRLTGIERGRIAGDDLALAVLASYVRLARLSPSLGHHLYGGLAFETGQAWGHQENPAISDLLVGGTVFLGLETLIGPIYAGYGLVEGGQQTFYAMLGRTF